jgi:hypothetical protein
VVFVIDLYIQVFYSFFLDNFIVLIHDLYVRFCLGFGANWFYMSFH